MRTCLFWFIPTPNGALCAPPPIAASLLLIGSLKIDKKLSNSGRPRNGLSRNKMLSFRLKFGPPASWDFFFPLDHRGYKIWGPLPPARLIAASLILLTIFCGQNYVRLRQYSLTFFVLSFLKIVFCILSFCYTLLISSYSSRTILPLLILLFFRNCDTHTHTQTKYPRQIYDR